MCQEPRTETSHSDTASGPPAGKNAVPFCLGCDWKQKLHVTSVSILMVQVIGCTKALSIVSEKTRPPPPGFINSASLVESNLLRTSAYLEKARFIQK